MPREKSQKEKKLIKGAYHHQKFIPDDEGLPGQALDGTSDEQHFPWQQHFLKMVEQNFPWQQLLPDGDGQDLLQQREQQGFLRQGSRRRRPVVLPSAAAAGSRGRLPSFSSGGRLQGAGLELQGRAPLGGWLLLLFFGTPRGSFLPPPGFFLHSRLLLPDTRNTRDTSRNTGT